MTREAPQPPGASGGDIHPEQPDPNDRLRSLLSVDIGEVPAGRRRRPSDDSGAPAGQPESRRAPDRSEPDPPATVGDDVTRRTRTNFVVWAMLGVLLLAGTGLAYAGSRIVRSSTEGRVVQPVSDPTAPGFEALVDPTPTMVVLHEADGSLDAITVLTLPDPEGAGGGVILVPSRTIYDMPLYEVNPIEIAYDLGSADFETDVVGQLLGTGIGATVVVDAARWTDLVAPVAPITIDNPDEIEIDGETRFELGEIELEAADVGPYLEARIEDEPDLARLFRHEIFWSAWLAAVAADGSPGAVPGEVDSGIGRFVRTIAAGGSVIETVPVQPATPGRYGDEPAFVPQFSELRELVARLVPFPVSASPGARARVRVINGTAETTAANEVARLIPPAGVQVTLVGNAPSFGLATTTISYAGDELRDEAEAIRSIIGVGEVVLETRPSDVADITVTLGADYG